MPPGPTYNWLCVLASTVDILSHAARIRASQVACGGLAQAQAGSKRKRNLDLDLDLDLKDGTSVEVYQTNTTTTTKKTLGYDIPKDVLLKDASSRPEISRERDPPPPSFSPKAPKVELDVRRDDPLSSPAEKVLEPLVSVSEARSKVKVEVGRDDPLTSPPEKSINYFSPIVEHSIVPPPPPPPLTSDSHVARHEQTPIPEPTPTPTQTPIPAPFPEPTPTPTPTQIPIQTPEPFPEPFPTSNRNLQSSKVPSSRIGRLFHYGGLAASLSYGAASEVIRRTTSPSSSQNAQNSSSVMLTEANIKRLVSKLSQMRGAALKLGQFLSIQDSHVLPPEIDKIFRRVQDSAHYMPDWQMEKVMTSSLGPDWSSNFSSFSRIPFAAASIGQVHAAVLAPHLSPSFSSQSQSLSTQSQSPSLPAHHLSPPNSSLSHLSSTQSQSQSPLPVAIKIQFPSIAHSITTDLSYITLLLSASSILPRGLFLEKTIEAMRDELRDECDYLREAGFARRFRGEGVGGGVGGEGGEEGKEGGKGNGNGKGKGGEGQGEGNGKGLGGDERYKVPWVWEGSTKEVLVMERLGGVSVGEAVVRGLGREDRDEIASRIIELCLRELFEFRMMQTDPNWSNFLWNAKTRQIELVDFGATREYSKAFMDNWLRLLQAAASEDRDACVEWSLKLGYLTGEENEIMLNAHITSMILLAAPFKASTPQPFSFGPGSAWSDITAQIRAQIPVMLSHRLTPPPRETYSLNRKLSGAFLLASRLGATVDTKALWDKVVDKYQFD